MLYFPWVERANSRSASMACLTLAFLWILSGTDPFFLHVGCTGYATPMGTSALIFPPIAGIGLTSIYCQSSIVVVILMRSFNIDSVDVQLFIDLNCFCWFSNYILLIFPSPGFLRQVIFVGAEGNVCKFPICCVHVDGNCEGRSYTCNR